AVYGSDAVAGVVNFITRDDFDGFAVDLTAYATEQGDANIYDLNLSYGHNFSNGKGNVTLYGGRYDRDSLFASERRITAVPIRDANGMLTEDGSLATPSSVITFPPVDFGNGPAMTTFDQSGLPAEFMDPTDRYNYAPLNYLQTPLTRTSVGIFLSYEVSQRSELYAEIGYTRNESEQNLAPIPVSNLYLTNLDNPLLLPATQQFFADNFAPPFLPPGTAGFFLSRRLEELGPRIFDRTRDYSRTVAGFRGALNNVWDFDVWLTYTKNDEDTLLEHGASAARFQQGLFVNPATSQCFDPGDGCVPLNIWGAGNLSAAGVDFLGLPDLVNTTSREQKLLSGYFSGSPFDTWAGPLDVAVGAEWRSDNGSFRADNALFTGDALGYRGSAGIEGRESVYEVFAEAVVPLASNVAFARYLGLELGARYSDYDNAGSVDTYKIGAEWQPLEALRFRMMLQRSVRAPNLAEAFQERFVETGVYVASNPAEDPCSASADPLGNGNVDACIATGLPANQIGIFEATVGIPTDFILGGNPKLKPETADTFTVGAVVTFGDRRNWQLSVDFFDLEIEDTIGDLVATVSCFDPANTQNIF
ncbi:MAG: TonB-dependent receptor, partial [Woeseiaceae bacterium]